LKEKIMNKKKLEISLSEKILFTFFIMISILFIIFFFRISNKCLFLTSLDESDLTQYKNDKIVILETQCGKVAIKLFTKKAPLNTKQILNLIRLNKYDDSYFYKVKKNKLIEFGDLQFGKKNNLNYLKIGTGGSYLENNKSELSNNYQFKKGSVGMVKRGKFDTENSQIFILLDENPTYDRQYTPVGEVIIGIEILKKIKYNNNSEFVLRPDYVEKFYLYNPN